MNPNQNQPQSNSTNPVQPSADNTQASPDIFQG